MARNSDDKAIINKNMENKYLHEVVTTAIIIKDEKYLITRRSLAKKRFPGMWTVPGGKLETSDYINLPKDTKEYWYNVLEQVLKREVKEEVGLEIENIEYVTSLATVHADGNPSLVISCIADYVSGEVILQESETDKCEWVSLEEAKKFDLIDGIYDELVMAENKRKGIKTEWKRF
jgi:8-oxo-dGTP pyrophosphatase MutT (NUDIX family)